MKTLTAVAASASPTCTAPKDRWKPQGQSHGMCCSLVACVALNRRGIEDGETLHRWPGCLVLALHAVAALVMGRIERTRLVKAMFTGVKERC